LAFHVGHGVRQAGGRCFHLFYLFLAFRYGIMHHKTNFALSLRRVFVNVAITLVLMKQKRKRSSCCGTAAALFSLCGDLKKVRERIIAEEKKVL
jgi:hypothetical protein